MSRWFRFYADAMRNPKVAALSDHDFRLWVELLALASENDGHIPPLESLKHVLKRRLDHLSRGLNGLIRALLIDALSDGYEPHNWSKFQYKSDTSTDRVHKFREKRNVSETPPEQIQSRAEIPAAKATGIARAKSSPKFAMPPDWKPGPLPPEYAELVAQWPEGREARELIEFRDYWIEEKTKRPGWDRTWRSRINDRHDRIMKESANGRSNTNRQTAPDGRTMGKTEAAVRAIAARVAGPGECGGNNHGPVALPDNRRAIGHVER